jgi:tetratricopeptide (TPR) repeat protein
VLFGRCWEEGGAPAFWPWIQVIREAGGDLEALAAPVVEASVDPLTLRFKLFDAATSFILAEAEKQTQLIVIEDLHAADAPSLLLLRFLSETIALSRVLVVASYRDTEQRVSDHAELFAGLARVARRISVVGLTRQDVADYVTAMTGNDVDARLVERLHRITGGNAFFLSEVTRLLSSDTQRRLIADGDVTDPLLRVPEEVRTLIRRRIAGLSEETITLLRLAAVAGSEFDHRILQPNTRLSAPRLLEALAEAVTAGLLLEDPSTPRHYAFAHELVRQTLHDDIPLGKRMALHRAVGHRLEQLHRGDLDAYLPAIAHHLAVAAPLGDVSEAIDYLILAGDRAAAVLAYEEAALHYRRALELVEPGDEDEAPRRCELLLRLGESSWRAGDTRTARSSFEEAARLARRLDSAEMLAQAALGYVTGLGGFLLYARFEVGDTAAGLLLEALDQLPADDSPLRARVLARTAVEMYSANELVERRLALSDEAIEMAHRLGDSEALVIALHSRHWALATPDLLLERLTNSEEMLRVASEMGSREMEFLAHNARFHAALEQCDGAGIDREIEAMATIAEWLRQPFYRWHVVCLREVRAVLDGHFADAERLAEEALRISELRQSQYAGYVFLYAQKTAMRWLQGRLQEMGEVLRPHAERFPWIPRWRDALVAAELRDDNAARNELDRHAARGFADLPRDGLWILHLTTLAECCVLLEDSRRAAELYELLLPYAERNAVSYTLQPFGPVALRLGMLARLLGHWDEAHDHFAVALGCCERLGARAIRPRILYEQARTLLARGEGNDLRHARDVAREAARLASDMDMPGVQARIALLCSDLDQAVEPPLPQTQPSAGEIMFRREGEFWTIGYGGSVFRLRDVKGLRYIALLASAPGRELHALELVQAVERRFGDAPPLAAATELSVGWPGGAEAVLDRRAKDAYGRRLQELEGELEEANEWRDGERAARIREEIDFLETELAAAVGLGGRDREMASPAERARVSATKAIKTAIGAVKRESPALAAHLTASIQTGRFCRYAPPGEAPPRWVF